MRTRLQALGLLDRSIRATSDDELTSAVEGLDEDHREALERLVGEPTPDAIRAAATKGRLDGTMESLALILTDAALSDCIEKLGDHADNPTGDQLREVLPGVVERHGLAITRMMLASTVAGEAAASAVIRDLLKNDDLVKLPPDEPRPVAPSPSERAAAEEDPERAALKAKRLEARRRKREQAAQRREQSLRARRR